MTSTMIRRRWSTRHGGWRYEVRYRAGGRESRWVSCGTFGTKAEADACLKWARTELAEGRIPDRRRILREQAAELPLRQTLTDAFTAYERHRVDLSTSRRADIGKVRRRLGGLSGLHVMDVTEQDVVAWKDGLLAEGLLPRSVKHYLVIVAQVLDHAGLTPNPARGDIRLPKQDRTIRQPPTLTEVAALISALPEKYRLPTRVLRDTGIRVGELRGLTWDDLDVQRGRLLIRGGKTTAARRWVPVPRPLLDDILATRGDAPGDWRVFPAAQGTALKDQMRRTSLALGVTPMHPHLLRHAYASRLLAGGMDPAALAQVLGHAKKSVTLDTYSWVIDREEDAP